jgi:DtxR family Mn-dependent transcriptional regulator
MPITIGILIGILAAIIFVVGGRRWLLLRRRVLWEDALKQIYAARQEGRPIAPSEIAGRLGLSPRRMLRLSEELENAGLVESRSGSLHLTPAGEQIGLQTLRGHRLWEQYLSGDTTIPFERLHRAAERAEHKLSLGEISALADHLGHPRTDPHGDIIPTSTGEFSPQSRTPLTDWPRDRLAVIVHVEDEPPQALKEAVAVGLVPGTVLRVIARDPGTIACETSTGRCTVSPAIAASIDLRAAVDGERLAKPPATLADLPLGDKAEVVALSEHCTGFGRRRLLDLGFTAGATVRAVLANLKDAAHAYEIRGSVIALRKEQADQVLVRPIGPQGAAPSEPSNG